MANQLVTPAWVTDQAREYWRMAEKELRPFAALSRADRAKFSGGQWVLSTPPRSRMVPLFSRADPRALIAAGVAAVIASPRKISRRGILGLAWKSR